MGEALVAKIPDHAVVAGRSWRNGLPTDGILSTPLTHMRLSDRLIVRGLGLIARPFIGDVGGLDHVRSRQPFILALNHSSRREVVLISVLLLIARCGQPVHFLADWNFRLIPVVGFLYRRAQVITLTGKSARPKFLNAFKPFFSDGRDPLTVAREKLREGGAIGVFPEGTINRDVSRLLRGRSGAARLSLETGVPVVPAGVRFTGTGLFRRMTVEFGVPITVGKFSPSVLRAPVADVRRHHSEIMRAIGLLAGKRWRFAAGENDDETHETSTHPAGDIGARQAKSAGRAAFDIRGREGVGVRCRESLSG